MKDFQLSRISRAAQKRQRPEGNPPGMWRLAAVCSLLLAGGAGQLWGGTPFTFEATGSMNVSRYAHTSTLLPSGKVLVAAGITASNNSATRSAETYDPVSGTWTETPSNMFTPRYGHTATLLPNGKVLIAGGRDNTNNSVASAEIFDPANGIWSTTGSMANARTHHTATLLPNGKVLVAGGYDAASIASLQTAEIYDPATGKWTATGNLAARRDRHTATLLPNGKVLVATGESGFQIVNTCELYDPASGTWTTTGSLATGRYSHTATLLSNGKVLVAAGYNNANPANGGLLVSAELYDPATGAWAVTGNLATARASHTAVLLPDGRVLVAGGESGSGSLASAELYDPARGSWSPTANMATARQYHTAVLLANEKVLVAGGQKVDGSLNPPALASAEQFNAQSGSWGVSGGLVAGRKFHTATLLSNGKVVVVGGSNNSVVLASAEVFNPALGTWSAIPGGSAARQQHTATLLPNGRVLVVGGHNGTSSLAGAELYDPVSGSWAATGNLATARANHTATLLANGKVLVTGGTNGSGTLASAELYDPATGAWTTTGSLGALRYFHTATLLGNGKVLVTGGSFNGTNGWYATAELYDPATGNWGPTGNLAVPRGVHTATLLPNGKVLVAGGYNNVTDVVNTAELYDPVSGTWTAAASMVTRRDFHTASLLPNGKVLVVGGGTPGGSPISSAELYDPASGTWHGTEGLKAARSFHTATILANGNVLIAGGFNGSYPVGSEFYELRSGNGSPTGSLATARGSHTATLLPTGKVLVTGGRQGNVRLASAELFDPANGAWSSAGTLASPRSGHSATLLRNGKVLVVGGIRSGGLSDPAAELYDPVSGGWSLTGALAAARFGHTATLLADGRVLVAGGYGVVGTNFGSIATAELYDPATGTWSNVGNMAQARYEHSATLLPNGDVLVVGGDSTGDHGPPLATAELFHPNTLSWTATGTLSQACESHTATLLPNGKVLVAAGFKGTPLNPTDLASAELYDPATGNWSPTGNLVAARSAHRAALLQSGDVLVVGGFPDAAEVYRPSSGLWSSAGDTQAGGYNASATLLLDGRILIAGGTNNNGHTAAAELREALPSATRAEWRPEIQTTTSALAVGGKLALSGVRFKGISQASSGTGQDSPANYPVVALRRLDNEQVSFLLADPSQGWSDSSFSSSPVSGFPLGPAVVTVFTNGIPSDAKYLLVGKASPTLRTQTVPAVSLGASVSDTATLIDGLNPTGTITFKLYGPDDATCGNAALFTSVVNVDPSGNATSGGYVTASPGLYRWIATYSGDANNDGISGPCNDPNESVLVSQAPSPSPSPTPTATPTGAPVRLGNISTRLRVETGDNALIAGFIITGTQPKKVILRGLGPSTGLGGAVSDPNLVLFNGAGDLLRANDNWEAAPNVDEIIGSTIPPPSSFEPAILMTLGANGSNYTAVLRGAQDETGPALVEAYDLDQSVDSRLANISTRGLVQTGDDVMIAGFIVLNGNQRVLLRGIGPSLTLDGKLADPTLELRDNNGGLIRGNDNWRVGGQEAEIIATTIPPTNDSESALVEVLAPGAYTAILRGASDTTGIGVVEVYALN